MTDGLQTYATLIDDLKIALTGSYRQLQATLTNARTVGVLESRLNLKWEELKVLAQQIIDFLQETISVTQSEKDKEADKAFKAIPDAQRTRDSRIWDFWRTNDPSDVVMVYHENYYMGMGYYLAFASHALKLERNTDLIRIYQKMGGVTVPMVGIPKHKIENYGTELRVKGITLNLIHN